jgi:hypothetical protein
MIDNDQDTDQMRGAKSTDFEQTISFRLNVIWTPQTGVCVESRRWVGGNLMVVWMSSFVERNSTIPSISDV